MAVFPKILIAWGTGLDLFLLVTLPLLGVCGVAEALNGSWIQGTCPESQSWRMIIYLFLVCGVVRALSGVFPEERGIWVASALTMIIEAAVVTYESRDNIAAVAPALGLLLPTFAYMMATVPAELKSKSK